MIFVDPVLYRKVKNLLQIMGPYYKEPIDFIVLWFNMRIVVDEQFFLFTFLQQQSWNKTKINHSTFFGRVHFKNKPLGKYIESLISLFSYASRSTNIIFARNQCK